MTATINTTSFVTELLGEDRPVFDRLVSIVVHARNEDVDYIPLMVEFMVRGVISIYDDAVFRFWDEVGEGEDWTYLGRDDDGEKRYNLMNDACEETRFKALFYQCLQEQAA